MPSRVIAIGDIHGCIHALDGLLEWITPSPEDVLVPLGDFVDRGEHSRQVVDRLMELRELTQLYPLMGNHEEMILASRGSKLEFRAWLSFGGVRTLDSYGFGGGLEMVPEEHWAFFESCLDYHETDEAIFVHANYIEDLPLEQQPPRTLRWESLQERLPGPHISGKPVIVGHTAQLSHEVLDMGYLQGIDTSCVHGGWLTGIDVISGQIWQVDKNGHRRG
jgi:serine/threonine protein phosphatase 1